MNESSPPLKIWGYTICVIVLLLSLSAIFIKSSEALEKISEEARNMINKSFIANKKGTKSNTSIIFLGSSLTHNALYNFRATEKILKINPNGKTNILRLTLSGLNNQIIEDSQIFDHIIEKPPDYLFIESNHINIDDKDDIWTSELLNLYLTNLISLAKIFIGIKEETLFSKSYPPENSFFTSNFNSDLYSQLLQKKRFVRKFSQNKKANIAFDELIKRNTKIVFLDMPRAQKLEMIWINPNQKKELQILLQTYYQKYGIACWKYPYAMNNSDFTDGGHLNYKGAKKYQEWLATQFKLLK